MRREHGRRSRKGGRHEGDRLLRNAGVEEYVLEEARGGNDEHHLGGLLDRVPEDGGKVAHPERSVNEEAEEHHVEGRDGGRFGRREDAAEHAAHHDDGGHEREEGLPEGLKALAPGRWLGLGVVSARGDPGGPAHEHDAEQEARHGARRKERVDARLREARVEDERDRGRDDGAEGAARRDRRAAERAPVARLRHFVDGDHADARRAGGRRAAHGGHDDAGDDGSVGESAPAVAEADASKPKSDLLTPPTVIRFPHEKEERNRHERDPRDLREHALRHEGRGVWGRRPRRGRSRSRRIPWSRPC